MQTELDGRGLKNKVAMKRQWTLNAHRSRTDPPRDLIFAAIFGQPAFDSF